MPNDAVPSPLIFLDAGDCAVTIEFGRTIDPAINNRVLALDQAVRDAAVPGVIETVPTYRSLTVQFDPLLLDYAGFEQRVQELASGLVETTSHARRWRVPVVYGGEFGVDLDDIAARHGISASRVIDMHAGTTYRVYMIGFLPGLAYLGGMDPLLATPRRLDPRARVHSGVIAIGGVQALVGSVEMPCGWHLLGRTPVRTYMLGRDPAFLLGPGDEVEFVPTDAARFAALERAAAAGDPVAEQVKP